MRFKPFWVMSLALIVGCVNQAPPERYHSKDYDLDEMTDLARRTLSDLQDISIAENREYCGVIGIDPNGVLRAAAASRGGRSTCFTLNVPFDWWIVGSYHTHGGYDPQIRSEVPTVQDMESVSKFRLVGFLSTPGGRFWKYDGKTQTAEQLCGVRCLPSDPEYRPDGFVETFYTLEDLRVLENSS